MLNIVKYQGRFGFIKPWTSVRDEETYSQQFLTESTLMGIEKKIFPQFLDSSKLETIVGYRLKYDSVTKQTEVTQPRGWNVLSKRDNSYERPYSIITRGLLLNPTLFLAFENEVYAKQAFKQHICLCRNEDLMWPISIIQTNENSFHMDSDFSGFELIKSNEPTSMMVGYNRYNSNEPMYGKLKVVGKPVKY